MKAPLGILLLSVLLTSGSALECETCLSTDANCSGKKLTCASGQDTCLSALLEVTVGSAKMSNSLKSCYSKVACKELKSGSSGNFGPTTGIIKSFECSRAPVTSGSFFLALSSLFFLKFLW